MNPTLPRKILMCVSGTSPAVITETLYALITQDEPFIPDEIHVVTTLTGKEKVREHLLAPGTGHFHQLMNEYLPGQTIRFDESTVHVISQEKRCEPLASTHPFGGLVRAPIELEPAGACVTELADIQTSEDNEAAANTIYRVMRELKAQPGTRLHASVAGGRKSMSFYMGHAFSLLADLDDSLSHVLVSVPFEIGQLHFYYPPRTPRTLTYLDSDKQPQEVCTADARIELAELSVLRLAGFLGQDWPEKAKNSLPFAVQLAQAALGAPKVKVVLDNQGDNASGWLEVCGEKVALPPLQFAVFALYAIACKYQDELPEGAAINLQALTKEFWRDLGDVSGHYFSKTSDFKIASSKIRDQLRQSVGPVEKHFQIVAIRSRVTGQKMLQVTPAQLELVNLAGWWKALRHDLM